MNNYPTLAASLPYFLRAPLFGDRERWGLETREDDPDWQAWLAVYMDFYRDTQKSGVGKRVNDAGYAMLRQVDLTGKQVLEIGPGMLPHSTFWRGKPAHYTVADIKDEFLEGALRVLEQAGVPATGIRSSADRIAQPDAAFDVVVSFYSLEHIVRLDAFVAEIHRVLRPGGLLVGGIPCEGGLAWVLGRYLTSRRYIKQHHAFDPDKIICWEHPNFAGRVLGHLDSCFAAERKDFWPFRLPLLDINLICSFIYRK